MLASPPWNDQLAAAFALLLDRPVHTDTGRYAAWYSCADLGIELFEEGFDPAPLAAGEIVRAPFAALPELGELLAGWDRFAPFWSIDLGGSLIQADTDDLPGLADGLTGRAFGAALAEHGIDPGDLADAYPTVVFRVHTDGTLFDALDTLTGTHRGPGHLAPLSPAHGIDPGWQERLTAVPDPALADHLRDLHRTADSARANGALRLGATDPSHGLLPGPVTAAWQFGEGQAWSAITAR